jgi:hypothetical protein
MGMRLLVVDGMGGGIGRAIISYLKENGFQGEIVAVGTNSAATNAMLKAGADAAATGTNAVVYNCAHADLIVGPIGIAFPNSMHGEISPEMAHAVGGSEARKLLLPVSRCNAVVVGTREASLAQLLGEMMELISNERGC